MWLPGIDTGKLSGLKYKLICRLKLAADLVGVGIRESVNETEWNWVWMGTCRSEFMTMQVDWCTFTHFESI